jgi:hypothetical protein
MSTIEDFLISYPSLDDKNFEEKIAEKKEFYDVRLGPTEKDRDPGKKELTDAQKFVRMMFSPNTPYPSALLYHLPGAGKTCASSAIIEINKFNELNPDKKKRGLVLVKNPVLIEAYKNEVSSVCTDEIYTAQKTFKKGGKAYSISEEAQKKRIRKAVDQSYDVKTYTFVLSLFFVKDRMTGTIRPRDPNLMRQLFSDRVIIVDEAHTIHQKVRKSKKGNDEDDEEEDDDGEVDNEEEEKKTPRKASTPRRKDEDDEADEGEIADENDINEILEKQQKTIYDYFFDFLHIVEGSIIILMTGSPIWDKVVEIAGLMNLILPMNELLLDSKGKPYTNAEFKKEFFDDDMNLIQEGDSYEKLKRAFRGRVSYVRGLELSAKKIDEGITKPYTKYWKIQPVVMSEFQSEVAKEAQDKEEKTITTTKSGKKIERIVKGGTISSLAIDAATMVIPEFDSSGKVTGAFYDRKNFDRVFKRKKESRRIIGGRDPAKQREVVSQKTYYQIPSSRDSPLYKELRDNLQEYSAKFHAIIEDIKAHPDRVSLVFIQEVTGVAGAIMFGLLMELHGFKWVKNSDEISSPSDTKRFCVITTHPQTLHEDAQIRRVISSINSDPDPNGKVLPSNAHAERLQVIIGSEKIMLGLTFKNVRQTYVAIPHWNIPTIDQAIARGSRYMSQQALPPNERESRIVKLAAVNPGKSTRFKSLSGEEVVASSKETIDIHVSRVAEEKDHINSQLVRLLKIMAFDCSNNYDRNVLEIDIDGSRACDYEECEYQCEGIPLSKGRPRKPKVDELDYSTFNILYSNDRVKEIMTSIIGMFKSQVKYSIDYIQTALEISDHEKPLLYKAIDNIINSRTVVRDALGFMCYLKEQGNHIYIDSNISAASRFDQAQYSENILVERRHTLAEFVRQEEEEKDLMVVDEMCKSIKKGKAKSQDVLASFLKLSYENQVRIFERVFVLARTEDVEGDVAESYELIIKNFSRSLFELFPEESEEPSLRKDSRIQRWVHILFEEGEFKGISYSVASKNLKYSKKMRIIELSRKKAKQAASPAKRAAKQWRTIEDREEQSRVAAEINEIRKENKEKMFEKNKYGVYGEFNNKDGAFRIFDKTAAGVPRGRNCETIGIPALTDMILLKLRTKPKIPKEIMKMDRDELLETIKNVPGRPKHKKGLDDLDDDRLRVYAYILSMNKQKELCEVVKTDMKEKGLLKVF